MKTLSDLQATHAGTGQIEWIGLRPARLDPMRVMKSAELAVTGLVGDRSRKGKRALTLLQAEHLPVIASLAHLGFVEPETLRRNIVVSGINLTALRHHPVRVGTALVQITVQCAPCSRMEAALGAGGYSAMRGHGGWCAEVLEEGDVAVGDGVRRA